MRAVRQVGNKKAATGTEIPLPVAASSRFAAPV